MSTTLIQCRPQPRQTPSYHHLNQLSLPRISNKSMSNPQFRSLGVHHKAQVPLRHIQLRLVASQPSVNRSMTTPRRLHLRSWTICPRWTLKARARMTSRLLCRQDRQLRSIARYVPLAPHSNVGPCSRKSLITDSFASTAFTEPLIIGATKGPIPSHMNAESSRAATSAVQNNGIDYVMKSTYTADKSRVRINFTAPMTATGIPMVQQGVLEFEKTMQRDTSERSTRVQHCC